MVRERQQTTIRRPISVSGFGFWSGEDVRVEFRPAPANFGIKFVRRDAAGMPAIPAEVQFRVEKDRRTNLSCGGSSVEMVEHVLASLSGLRIDNCQVWVDRSEMPGFDGSSKPFVDALLAAGVCELPATRSQIVISSTIRVGDHRSWISASPHPLDCCEIVYELDYPNEPAIGRQSYRAVMGATDFAHSIAPARTFVTQSEADFIRQQGLAQRVSYSDLLVFDQHGPINNKTKYENECARHKLLDVVGDLSLAGSDIVGRITAYRSGHRLNAELVQQLLRICSSAEISRKAA